MRYQVLKKGNIVIYAVLGPLGSYALIQRSLDHICHFYPKKFVKQIVVNSAKLLFKFAYVAHRPCLYVG